MAKIVLDDVTRADNVQKINENFTKLEQELQNKILYRDNPVGEPNQMENDLDMNSNDLLNVAVANINTLVVGGTNLNQKVLDAANSATAAKISEDNAKVSEDNAKASEEQAALSALSVGFLTFDSLAGEDGLGGPGSLIDANFLTVGLKVRTLGYYTPGDGGGNDYEIGTGFGTDDGGSVIDLSGSGFQAKGLFPLSIYKPEMFGAINAVSGDYSAQVQSCADFLENIGGGVITLSPSSNYRCTDIKLKTNVGIVGQGFSSVVENIGLVSQDAITYSGTGADTTSTDRVIGQFLYNFTLKGNPSSGNGLVVRLSGATDNGVLDRKPTVPDFSHLKITEHGLDGVVIGNSASFGAGNLFPFHKCQISYNGGKGVLVQGQSNLINIVDSVIHNNGSHGVHLNFIVSTCSIRGSLFMDNGGWGVFAFSAEEPLIAFCGFNRNSSGAVALSGNATKYTEAAVIMGNLFGDNGSGAATQREVSLTYAKGTTLKANYFYGTGQDTMVYIADFVEGADISGNHFKDLTTEVKLEVKAGVVGSFYTFRDDQRADALSRIITNQVIENVITSGVTLFRNRADGNSNDLFNLRGSGEMNWGSGSSPTDVSLSRVVAGSLRCSGGLEAQTLMVTDGISEPSVRTGYARLYVDSADGDLKVKFQDGTVKTIVTDTP